jgi:predicted secreted protein
MSCSCLLFTNHVNDSAIEEAEFFFFCEKRKQKLTYMNRNIDLYCS